MSQIQSANFTSAGEDELGPFNHTDEVQNSGSVATNQGIPDPVDEDVQQVAIEGDKIKFVVAGKSGTGKSTLVNNILALTGGDCAESRVQPTSVTEEVKCYDGKLGKSIALQAFDMPGLHARRHAEERKSRIIAELIKRSGGEADVLLYCISLKQRLDMIDEKNIKTLNDVFGPNIWANTIFILTHADSALEDMRPENKSLTVLVQEFVTEIQEIFNDLNIRVVVKPLDLRSLLQPVEGTATVSVTVGDNPENKARSGSGVETSTSTDQVEPHPPTIATDQSAPQSAESNTVDQVQNTQPVAIAIPTGKIRNEPLSWTHSLIQAIIRICHDKIFSLALKLQDCSFGQIVKAVGIVGLDSAKTGVVTGVTGAAVGTAIGAGIGAIVGGVLTAPIGGVGAFPTAAGGAAVGAWIGTVSGTGIGIPAAIIQAIRSAKNKEIVKKIKIYKEVSAELNKLKLSK